MDKQHKMQTHWTIVTPLIVAGLLLACCWEKRGSKRDLDLLTNTPWKYERAGFDSNNDGIFDALDPNIAGGERDNSIIFARDGTGINNNLPFIWAFQNSDSTIYFQDRYFRIRTLNRHRLEIYSDEKWGGVNSRYIIILKH